jgi:hypothetical protein
LKTGKNRWTFFSVYCYLLMPLTHGDLNYNQKRDIVCFIIHK